MVSFEARADFAEIARENVRKYFGEVPGWWRLVSAPLSARAALDPSYRTDRAYSLRKDSGRDGAQDGPGASDSDSGAGHGGGTFDRVILDMLALGERRRGGRALIPGGLICCYVATTTQLSRIVEGTGRARLVGRACRWGDPSTGAGTWRGSRSWPGPPAHLGRYRASGEPARRLADGVTPPARRRRPGQGIASLASAMLRRANNHKRGLKDSSAPITSLWPARHSPASGMRDQSSTR